MKKFLFLFLVLFISIVSYAQLEVKSGSFKEVPGFVNINTDIYEDDNNVLYAVIKVNTENINDKQRHQLLFQGNAATFIEVEYKVGEVWVYLSSKPATYLKISHPDFGSTEFWFPFDLAPKKGYEMVLVNKAFKSSGMGYITVKSTPKGADVFVDNEKVGVTPYLSEVINVGNHKISVSLEGYEPVAKRVDIEVDKESEVIFELVSDNIQKKTDPQKNNKADIAAVKSKLKSGKFSVNVNRKVYFAQGNLQYQASTRTWKFADNQWEYLGKANKNISSTNDGWIDLFGWGTGNNPTRRDIDNEGYIFSDWGNNAIINGGNIAHMWRTLSKDEWVYLIEKRRTKSGIRYAKGQVNGVGGLILLPDNWDPNTHVLNETNKKDSKYNSNVINKSEWLKMEQAGAIFLPAAGFRSGGPILTMGKVGVRGWYWSNTVYNFQDAYYLWLGEKDLDPASSLRRCTGGSVRLVCDTE